MKLPAKSTINCPKCDNPVTIGLQAKLNRNEWAIVTVEVPDRCSACNTPFSRTAKESERRARRREQSREWHERNPDYRKNYYAANREKIREQRRKWERENPDKVREYRAKSRESRMASIREWRQKNSEYWNEYYRKNKQAICEYNRNYYQRNKEAISERKKALRIKRKEASQAKPNK